MPKAPSYLSPLNNPDKALNRRNQVLLNMYLTDKISKNQYENARESEIELAPQKKKIESYSWYVNYVRQKLENEIGYELLYKSGLNIYTSLDTKIQDAAQKSVKKNMAFLKKRMKAKNIESNPECAVVAIDIKSGKVLALIGGTDFKKSRFNRALMAKRQPGSSFKPFIYALALKQGYSQNDTLRDVPTIFNIPGNKEWKPQNFSKTFLGEITFRKALAKSKNIPVIRLLEKISPSKMIAFSHDFGFNHEIKPTLSLALGSYETTLLEITNAYCVFPGKGIYRPAWFIDKIIDKKKEIYLKKDSLTKRVYPIRESAIMVDMLKAVVTEGTGKRGAIKGYPLAGKTGTTDNYRDALFVGFSPSVALGVWVGCDDNTSLGKFETGAKAALPIWKDIMQSIVDNKKYPEYFPVPDKIVYKTFNPDSGKILNDNSSEGVTGIFLKENKSG